MEIHKLILESPDLYELHQFYEQVLEIPVSATKKSIKFSIGNTELIFRENKQFENIIYHYAITIPSNKIHEAKEWLSGRVRLIWIEDYQNVIADFFNWNAKSVYFFDAAGNIIECIARFDLHNNSKEIFDSKQFLTMSEIGLVFSKDEIERKTLEIMKTYSLSYFRKQPPLPMFKAIGDDNGLFIIVPENRSWYPTDKPAGMFPLEVEFGQEGIHYHLKIDPDNARINNNE